MGQSDRAGSGLHRRCGQGRPYQRRSQQQGKEGNPNRRQHPPASGHAMQPGPGALSGREAGSGDVVGLVWPERQLLVVVLVEVVTLVPVCVIGRERVDHFGITPSTVRLPVTDRRL